MGKQVNPPPEKKLTREVARLLEGGFKEGDGDYQQYDADGNPLPQPQGPPPPLPKR